MKDFDEAFSEGITSETSRVTEPASIASAVPSGVEGEAPGSGTGNGVTSKPETQTGMGSSATGDGHETPAGVPGNRSSGSVQGTGGNSQVVAQGTGTGGQSTVGNQGTGTGSQSTVGNQGNGMSSQVSGGNNSPEETYPESVSENVPEPTVYTEGERPYQDLYDRMREYNESLSRDGQKIVDVWSYEQEPFDLSSWEFLGETPTIGYIDIPDMEIVLPLFLGASPENLEKGAAVLSQTSMPIGGESTNCVIAGHRGWEGSAYFQYVENMHLGSRVYVTNPWETLVYECTEIQIIYPDDIRSVLIRPGKDLITLFTCHPYALGGGPYRYLVFCERVDTQERKAGVKMENPKVDKPAENVESVDSGSVGVLASAYSASDVNVEQPPQPDLNVQTSTVPETSGEVTGQLDVQPNQSGTSQTETHQSGTGQSVTGQPSPATSPLPVSVPPDYEEGGFDLLALERTLRFALPAALAAATVLLLLLRAYNSSKSRKRKKRKKKSSHPAKRGTRNGSPGGKAGRR